MIIHNAKIKKATNERYISLRKQTNSKENKKKINKTNFYKIEKSNLFFAYVIGYHESPKVSKDID